MLPTTCVSARRHDGGETEARRGEAACLTSRLAEGGRDLSACLCLISAHALCPPNPRPRELSLTRARWQAAPQTQYPTVSSGLLRGACCLNQGPDQRHDPK